MNRIERSNPLAVVAAAAMGAAVGLVLQFLLSHRGQAPFVPPLSLALSLAVIGAVLLVLGIRLRRALQRGVGAVNPFHAVRLLAAARAGQLVGGIVGGFGAGLALSLLGRSVAAPAATWWPMLAVVVGGAILIACAAITEHLCKVPPSEDDTEDDTDPELDGSPSDSPAYRKP